MADFQAFLVITVLTLAAVTISRTTPELSTTTGDTVNIPCLFGEGTLRHIFWYYNGDNGPQQILLLSKGVLAIDPEYADRASLQNNNSTLIMREITVADEGTYRCDVDRQGQTVVTNINTNLNVFSLRPDTLPVITPCSRVDESSSCIVHRNQSFTLTCTLPNVYPVEDTELIWYQDGKRVLSTGNITQNDDGTTDISRQIQVSKTGNFTCNATYISANGRVNTAVSVEACIIPPANVPKTPDKNLTYGPFVGIALSIATVLIVGILLCIVIIRSHCCSKRDEQNSEVVQPDPAEELTLLETSAKDGSKDGNAESSDPTGRPTAAAKRSKNEEVSSNPTEETFIDDILMAIAVKMQDDHINQLGKELGFDKVEIERYVARNSRYMNLTCAGTLAMLRDWDKKRFKARERAALKKALMAIGLDHLADNFLSEEGSEWKKYGGYMEDLDAALIKAELGGLVPHYMNYTPTKGTKYVDNSNLPQPPTETQERIVNRSDERKITEGEIITLAKLIPHGNYTEFCVALGLDINYSKSILTTDQSNYIDAFEDILKKWSTHTGGFIHDLDKALVKAELGGLRDQYRM